jgi:tetratricopeptide (TPR) repeat protein
LPSVESILNEAIELVAPSAKVGDADRPFEIAMRQAKVRSCEKAKDLFRMAIDLNEKWAKERADNLRTEARIAFLDRVVAAQRRAGCVEEMKYTAGRLLALYREQNQKHLKESAGNELATAVHNLQFQLNLGNLYLSMGDLDAVRDLAPKIIQQVRAAKWRPSLEFESAAVFLARMGHDEEALEIVNRYDQFFEMRQEIKEDLSNKHWWVYRVGNLAAVAEAQAEAGHKEAARATLRRAIEKARSTPVARLTEVYGVKHAPVQGKLELNALGEGVALQSAGAMAIVWHAARIGETTIALEAFELVSPLANEAGSAGALITALAKEGEVVTAQKLLDRFQCSSRAIARGLLEKQDWAGAIQADEAYQKSSCCERECNFLEVDTDYWADLGKARTIAQGEALALTWARNQKVYKVYALLGIVDALVDKN